MHFATIVYAESGGKWSELYILFQNVRHFSGGGEVLVVDNFTMPTNVKQLLKQDKKLCTAHHLS